MTNPNIHRGTDDVRQRVLDDVVPVLLTWLRHDNEGVRRYALNVLTTFAEHGALSDEQ